MTALQHILMNQGVDPELFMLVGVGICVCKIDNISRIFENVTERKCVVAPKKAGNRFYIGACIGICLCGTFEVAGA